MHTAYDDITSRLGQPLWWFDDSAAVPRYDPFKPEMCGVYDDHVALCEIECQACQKTFLVSTSVDTFTRIKAGRALGTDKFPEVKFPTKDDAGWFDTWGDPPIHSCVGDTMISSLVRIVEFWSKDKDLKSKTLMDFVRKPEYEFDYSESE